jgi:hypothetical protein
MKKYLTSSAPGRWLVQKAATWRKATLAMGLVAAAVTGCTIYSTNSGPPDTTGYNQGVPYFLPKGMIHIVISETTSSTGPALLDPTVLIPITRTITVQPVIVADKDQGPESARYLSNSLQDDFVDLHVDHTTNLLTTVSGTTNDETGTILTNLAEIATNVGEIATESLHAPGPPKPSPSAIPYRPIDFDETIDPDDDQSSANRILSEYGIHIQVRHPAYDTKIQMVGPIEPADGGKVTRNGIWFRQIKAYDVVITERDSSKYSSNIYKDHVITVVLPDKSAPFVFNVSRGAFIKKITSLDINNGMLQGFHIEKPSEAQGLTQSLVAVTGTLASLPSNVLGAKLTLITSKGSVIEQQTKVLNDEVANLQAQQLLNQQMHPSPSPVPVAH